MLRPIVIVYQYRPSFYDDGNSCHSESQIGGTFDNFPVEDFVYFDASRIKYSNGDDEESKADEHGGKGFEFTMSVRVVAVFVFR